MNGQEIEVKFYVQDLKAVEKRLLEMKALLIQPRIHELNYRYDLPDGSLRANGRVLRLRKDAEACLTYKGPSALQDGIFSREELEFTVGDFDTAQKFLEALGYVRIFIYEKKRAIYDLQDCHIMLDELPFGEFVEIEGPDTAAIRLLAAQLNLNMEYAVGAGYARIFENYNMKYGLAQGDLTFEALSGKKPTAGQLNIRPAD
ncbi:MAG: class IV adenylate cyclase [Chloroflexi bacterium]|nr:class IV adenylate cyclase [Chloroflexota bacterium]